MVIGVPKEIHRHEHRVGLTPFAVECLSQGGNTVLVESGAGEIAHFTDRNYERAGGQIVYSPEEAYLRADLVCRVGLLADEEIDLIKPGSTICAFHHLAVNPRANVDRLMDLGVTLIGYEIIADIHGDRPVLMPFSEMAGQMAVHLAAQYLQIESGGRGVLLGNIPGVPPPTVVILGAGSVGRTAARHARAGGAHVIVLDQDLRKLTSIHDEFAGQVVTVPAADERLRKYTRIADVLIGAVLIPGARAPFLVTESMVAGMKPGSVVIDVSIDQGGCVETSRPTTLTNATYKVHGVVHYCVPNMTANIARTASRALTNAALPYLEAISDRELDSAVREDPGLAAGLYLYRGKMVNETVGETLGVPFTPLDRLLDPGRTP